MPELPDVELYVERIRELLSGKIVRHVTLHNPFVLRSVTPPIDAIQGLAVRGAHRIGKRIVIDFDANLHLAIHLMIAGRLRWRPPGKRLGKIALAELGFDDGSLYLTEAGSTRRASLHLVQGDDALLQFDRGGAEPLQTDRARFAEQLALENHTLKRALTDPRLFSGIGNAYSDEILHVARLSPLQLTSRMTADEIDRLYRATQSVLSEWSERLRSDVGDGFPEEVTAFRPEMRVHGRSNQPCPECGAPIQRIRYASNETNYCAVCQTGGRRLADRAMSRLLKDDWPREME